MTSTGRDVRTIYDEKVAADLRRDPDQEQVVARLDALRSVLLRRRGFGPRRLLSRDPPAGGVYLWGEVGRGKSMLVDMFIRSLEDVPIRRAHFHAFMRDIHKALHAERADASADPITAAIDTQIRGQRLLVLDELEITDIVDAMIVGRVFDRVLSRGISIATTSNRAPSDLYRDGLKRDLFVPFVDLVEDRLDVIRLGGARDYRRSAHEVPSLRRIPAEGRLGRGLDEIWAALPDTGESWFEFGRRGRIRQKGTAVRAPFAALCSTALAPADFLNLAEAVETVMIEDIPALSDRDRDAVRRFMILIDALYDAGCDLVLGAAPAPDELYRGDIFAEAFARTASRLHEMAGPGWPGHSQLT